MSFLNEEAENELTVPDKLFPQFGNPISVMFSGRKGEGKSVLSYTVHRDATYVIIDFDGNARTTLQRAISEDKHENYYILDVKSQIDYVNMRDKFKIPKKATEVVNFVFDFLESDQFEDMNPNVVVFDGLHMWAWLCEMKMRQMNQPDKSAFSGVDLNFWKERNWYMDRSFKIVEANTKDVICFTSHEYEKTPIKMKNPETGEMEEMQVKDASWKSTIKQESQVVVEPYHESTVTGGNNYFALIHSNKVTGKEGNLDITDNPNKFWKHITGMDDIIPLF